MDNYKYELYDDRQQQEQQQDLYTQHFVPLKLNESWAGRRLLEALSQLPPNKLSSSLDMKFQQKQLLEREQKKLALTGGDGSVSDTSVTSKSSIGNGKVRQMFDDRRRGVGIDRSHPLKPITTTTSTTSTVTTKTSTQQPATIKRLAGGANAPRRTVITNNTTKQTTTLTTVRSINNNHQSSNGSNGNLFNDTFGDVDNLDNETFPKEFSSLSLDNTRVMGSHIVGDRFYDNDNNNEGESDVLDATITISKRVSPKTNGIKLNPVIMKKSPNTTTKSTLQNRTPSSGSRASTLTKTNNNNSTKSPVRKSTGSTANKNVKTKPVSKAGAGKPATFVMAVKPPPRVSTPPPGMAACQYCQRNFNADRLGKHEEVCRKMTITKRKIFDASKHRVKGTEAEKYLKKGKVTNTSSAPKPTSVAATIKAQTNDGGKKSNWRKKHEEFITAIREAKKVQAYLAKGGKLSDLPPPPPSENPDYIQCPHCSRRFNVSAAERHIPKCANMQHNKPKPPAARKRY